MGIGNARGLQDAEQQRGISQGSGKEAILTDLEKAEIFNHGYDALEKNILILKSDERFEEKSNLEIANIAYYRGVMEKFGEIQGLPVDYNKYDTKAFLFGVPHVEDIENHKAVKEHLLTNSKNKHDGHSL